MNTTTTFYIADADKTIYIFCVRMENYYQNVEFLENIWHNFVFVLCNDCRFKESTLYDEFHGKTRNFSATMTDKDNNITLCNHSCGLVQNSDKLQFAKDYLASFIQKGDTLLVHCNTFHRSIDNCKSVKK